MVIRLGMFLARVLQASLGLPLISMAQEPQIAARQTKSNINVGSRFSRIRLSATNMDMPSCSSSLYSCILGLSPGMFGLKRKIENVIWRILLLPSLSHVIWLCQPQTTHHIRGRPEAVLYIQLVRSQAWAGRTLLSSRPVSA